VDQQRAQNINQAMEQLTDSAQQSFQMLADRTVRVQERNLMLTQSFFQNWIEQVHNQAEGTRDAAQDLQEQSQRQREAFETLSQEATNAYSEYLNSALAFYQEAMSTASQVAQGNMQNAAQFTQQGMQAASQAGQQAVQAASQAGQQAAQAGVQSAQQGAQAANQAAQQGAESANQSAQQGARGGEQVAQAGAQAAENVATRVPIRDYDDLNVGEIVEQLENLSVEELQAARAYEQQNKNRDTLLEQIDRRIMEASGVPIRDYNSLNVGEIVDKLDNLSVEELQAARAYEQQNKNRDTLLEQIDRRINAAS
jgi:uncharacterized protein (DUF433 family)